MPKISPQRVEALRQKQLQVNHQLQAELYRNINNSRNNEYCINAAKNPSEFMKQNINSLQTIPKNLRQDIINPNAQQNDKKSIWQKFMAFYTRMMRYNSYLMMVSVLIPGIGLYQSFSNNKEIIDVQGKVLGTYQADSIIRMPVNLMTILVQFVLKVIDFLTGSIFNLSATSGTSKVMVGENQIFQYASGGWWITIISLTLAFLPMILTMVKRMNSRNKQVKQQEYAQTHQMVKEDVTDKMLYADDIEYYNEMKLLDEEIEILNEGLFSWIKSILPTPKNLLRLVNRGFLTLARFAKSIEEGLKLNSISPFTAQFYNILLSISNIILTIAKGALLILAGITGTNTRKVEAEHIQQKEAIQNGGAQ